MDGSRLGEHEDTAGQEEQPEADGERPDDAALQAASPFHRQSSSASRRTAGDAGFLTLSQCAERPARYGEPKRFETMPSQPSAHACDAIVWEPQELGQPALAVLDRLAPKVLAVHLQQVERAEHGAGIGGVATDEVEHGQAAVAADDGLAVGDARADGECLDRFGDQGEAYAKSLPLRVTKRTLRPRRLARIRKPSCLIS
jgi:hypothetical protein